MGDVKGLLDPEFLGKLAVSTAGFAAGGPLGAAAAAGGYEAATGGDLESSLTQAGIAGLGGAASGEVSYSHDSCRVRCSWYYGTCYPVSPN